MRTKFAQDFVDPNLYLPYYLWESYTSELSKTPEWQQLFLFFDLNMDDHLDYIEIGSVAAIGVLRMLSTFK